LLASALNATVPLATVTEMGWAVKTGTVVTAGVGVGVGVGVAEATTTVKGNTEDIPVPMNPGIFAPPCSLASAKPCNIKVYVPAAVGVPAMIGVVVLFPDEPDE
jgi:hypothetical protein